MKKFPFPRTLPLDESFWEEYLRAEPVKVNILTKLLTKIIKS
jgi:hypothetical protein